MCLLKILFSSLGESLHYLNFVLCRAVFNFNIVHPINFFINLVFSFFFKKLSPALADVSQLVGASCHKTKANVAQLVGATCRKPKGHGFDSPVRAHAWVVGLVPSQVMCER